MADLNDSQKARLVEIAALKMRNDPKSTVEERRVMDEIIGLGVGSMALLYDALNASGYYAPEEAHT